MTALIQIALRLVDLVRSVYLHGSDFAFVFARFVSSHGARIPYSSFLIRRFPDASVDVLEFYQIASLLAFDSQMWQECDACPRGIFGTDAPMELISMFGAQWPIRSAYRSPKQLMKQINGLSLAHRHANQSSVRETVASFRDGDRSLSVDDSRCIRQVDRRQRKNPFFFRLFCGLGRRAFSLCVFRVGYLTHYPSLVDLIGLGAMSS